MEFEIGEIVKVKVNERNNLGGVITKIEKIQVNMIWVYHPFFKSLIGFHANDLEYVGGMV